MAILQGAQESWTKSSYSGGNGACVEVRSPVVGGGARPPPPGGGGPRHPVPPRPGDTNVNTVKEYG
ncbi:DUF397 domain-containing protein, partial [Streptomyces coelicoflavus]|uniref:DUF397 domain-containing protein n=1 Tax=Streptomyces coelicoflavus TaxID=285562 RepID=UPI00368D7AFE